MDIAGRLPWPGDGSTAELWEFLATVAAVDVGAARMLEPHLDALGILRQAGNPDLSAIGTSQESSWGVFAAEGPGVKLEAIEDSSGWTLTGTKPWCSLADVLSHALVTAHVGDGERRLFAINVRDEGVSVHEGPWTARGLQNVKSTPITLADVRAIPVGETNWYVKRPGFHWGGMAVAACWWGGTVGVSRKLFARLVESANPIDPIIAMHAGAVDVQLASAQAMLRDAAAAVDSGEVTGRELARLAKQVRSQVFNSAEATLTTVAHALGPTPLVSDEDHARRVADLDLYIRQHHAEKDDVSLGKLVYEAGALPW
ncbi:acyl-CoA dehydrogenase [Leifsonia sp. A12D58]|uniref:acyl-CoA dehydrogenase n=1 Tax=Leifsonia sp. A12D58 TaxID=3397674 RepID=UPI0039DFB7D5